MKNCRKKIKNFSYLKEKKTCPKMFIIFKKKKKDFFSYNF